MRPTTIDEVVKDYVFVCRTEGKSPKTVRWYEHKLDHFSSFLERNGSSTEFRMVTREDVRAFSCATFRPR